MAENKDSGRQGIKTNFPVRGWKREYDESDTFVAFDDQNQLPRKGTETVMASQRMFLAIVGIKTNFPVRGRKLVPEHERYEIRIRMIKTNFPVRGRKLDAALCVRRLQGLIKTNFPVRGRKHWDAPDIVFSEVVDQNQLPRKGTETSSKPSYSSEISSRSKPTSP